MVYGTPEKQTPPPKKSPYSVRGKNERTSDLNFSPILFAFFALTLLNAYKKCVH